MNEEKKYIFVDGVMKLNPAYQKEHNQSSTIAEPDKALATVSSPDDIIKASETHLEAKNEPMHLADSTFESMKIMQDQDFLNDFHSPEKMSGDELLDKLGNVFAKYEVPIGLVNKLLALKDYKLNFIMDDSLSMTLNSDVLFNQATDYLKRQGSSNTYMTRWQEAQDRLHIMIDMLAYIPTETITISFLNRKDVIVLNHSGKTPEQFARQAHDEVSKCFARGPSGGTPIYSKLSQAFNNTKVKTMHYLFTDGVPDNGTKTDIDKVKNLIISRQANLNPLTFISCTDQDQETEWMKAIDEDSRTQFVAEIDDFEDEKQEVLKNQGPALPFSKGFWILCQLVGAINPNDLDAISKWTI